MNEAKAIERALFSLIRQFADIGAGVAIRPWQSLRLDPLFDADAIDGDRTLPAIDIRCSAPRWNENERTQVSACEVEIATNAEDDRDHKRVSDIYEAVKTVTDALRTQLLDQATGGERTLFESVLTEDVPALHLGGIVYGEPLAPYDDDGVNVMGMSIEVHHA